MKFLLVTNQYIDIKDNQCYCNRALYGTLENMSILGEMHVAALKQDPNKPVAQPIDHLIPFLNYCNVSFLRPTNITIASNIRNTKNNRTLLRKLIPEFDLIIGYIPSDNAEMAFKISQDFNKPFLSFLVGCPWDALHNHHRILARILAPFSYMSVRNTIKGSDYVHYVTKEFLQRRYPTNGISLGCSDTNLQQISKQSLINRTTRNKCRRDDDDIIITTTANVDVRYKGQEYIIKAIAELKALGYHQYKYYLIGAGTGAFLKELAKKLKVENQVHFLGRKTSEEVMDLLTNSDIYVQPSLQEGLPRSVIEAMSQALPCIGFNTGGIPELLCQDMIVNKKDVSGLVSCLLKLRDKDYYEIIATENFNNSCDYQHDILRNRIVKFFKFVSDDIKNNIL